MGQVGGLLSNDTPVWCEGMSDWTLAGQIAELSAIVQKRPPVFNQNNPGKRTETNRYNYVSSAKKNTSRSKWLSRIGVFAGIVLLFAYFISRQNDGNIKEREKQNFLTYPELYVTVRHNGYNYNKLLGGISNLKFTIVNNSDYFIDNARVIVTYVRKNGATYKEEFVDVQNIAASSEKIVDAPNSDAGVDIKLRLSSVTSADARQR